MREYPINSRVTAHISRGIPSGLLCHLEDGQRAIIRSREISWAELLPVTQYIGQTLEAVVIGYNPVYHELELSLRCAQHDPWYGAPAKYHVGCLVQGEVRALVGSGAFVELEDGIEAFLPLGELPPDESKRMSDRLWLGDHVRAMVSEIDASRRRLEISVRALLAGRERERQHRLWAPSMETGAPEAALAEMLSDHARLQLLRMKHRPSALGTGARLRVLLIEDDGVYGSSLKGLLERSSCEVVWERIGDCGLKQALAPGASFQLILVDWNLPGTKGTEVVRRLQEAHCPARLAMILNPAFGPLHADILDKLKDRSVDAFSKANEAQFHMALLGLVSELRQGAAPAALGTTTAPDRALSPPSSEPTAVAEESVAAPGAQDGVDAVLAQLARDAQASTAMLFRLERGRSRLLVEGSAGAPFAIDQAPLDPIYSPLADVVHEGQEVCERVSAESRRFVRLLEVDPFEGFLGIPLPPVESSPYGLVLLKKQGGFGLHEQRQARLAAYIIAGRLQERRLTQVLQPWQAQNLRGQVSSSLMHEVNNKLGGIGLHAERLRMMVGELARRPERARDGAFLQELDSIAEGLAEAQRQAAHLRDQYLGLTATDAPRPLDLKSLAEETAEMLHTEAQSHSVLISVGPAKDVPMPHARASLLKQLLLNLLLNAVQQMARLRRQGRVMVEISHRPEAALPILVRVVDEGPGIHRDLWERIFDFGFTSKEGGAGLGLTISRAIARSLGGRLRVDESWMLWGTTFLLELPKGGQGVGGVQHSAGG